MQKSTKRKKFIFMLQQRKYLTEFEDDVESIHQSSYKEIVMESDVKLCKDCKWYSNDFNKRCKYPHRINIVTGEVDSKYCLVERESFGRCKVQAIYFEKKITLASIIKCLYNNIVSYLKRSTITLK